MLNKTTEHYDGPVVRALCCKPPVWVRIWLVPAFVVSVFHLGDTPRLYVLGVISGADKQLNSTEA